MNNPFKHSVFSVAPWQIFLISSIIILISSCKTAQNAGEYDYICTEHSKHRLFIKEELAECMKINPSEIGNYHIFRENAETADAEHSRLFDKILDSLEDRIVEIITVKIEAAMGNAIKKHWQFDRISLPAVFRHFRHYDGRTYRLTVAAAIRKADIEPKGIIRFLPLEYKMDILEKKGEALEGANGHK
jgi:hypothetical protein